MPDTLPGLTTHEQTFSFAWQTTFWDGSTEMGTRDSEDKKVKSFTNYHQANQDDSAIIHSRFDGYELRRFRALSVAPDWNFQPQDVTTAYESTETIMTIELNDYENIIEEEFVSQFQRITCVAA